MVVGICLNKVLAPALRKYIERHMHKTYNALKSAHKIDRQTHAKHLKMDGTHRLNYEAINNNKALHGRSVGLYNYKVASHVDMAKLYLQTHMAKFSAFDESCDPSATLGILCTAPCFPGSLRTDAQDVRANVRNEWAHCNFADWSEVQFLDVFQNMERLVRSLGLPKKETDDIVTELNEWLGKGT